MLETLVLSVLNYDSSVASAAARMVSVAARPAHRRDGLAPHRRARRRSPRRAPPTSPASTRPRTSRPAARWGIPTMGTAAHAFTLLHDTRGGRVPRPGRGARAEDHAARRHLRHRARASRRPCASPAPSSAPCASTRATCPPSWPRCATSSTRSAPSTRSITVTSDLDEFTIAGLSRRPRRRLRRRHRRSSPARVTRPRAWSTSSSPAATTPATGSPWRRPPRRRRASAGARTPLRRLDSTRTAREELVASSATASSGEARVRGRRRAAPAAWCSSCRAASRIPRSSGHAGTERARAHRAEVHAGAADRGVPRSAAASRRSRRSTVDAVVTVPRTAGAVSSTFSDS